MTKLQANAVETRDSHRHLSEGAPERWVVAENAVPLDPASAFAVYCRDLATVAARLVLRPVRRTRAVVQQEYDEGHWRRLLESRGWETAETLDAFLLGSDQSKRVAKINGRIVAIPQADYARVRLRGLTNLVRSLGSDSDTLVELGCGPGLNLFSLACSEGWRKLEGYDISANALKAGRAIAEHYGLDNVSFDQIDLTDPSHPSWERVAGATVLTYFCLEQLPGHTEQIIDRLIVAKPRRVIHVESTTEPLRLWKPLDWLNYCHILSNNYQRRLFQVLERRAAEGYVRIVYTGRMPYAPTLLNDGFIVSWCVT